MRTLENLRDDLMRRLKLNLTSTQEKANCDRWINSVYQDFQSRHSWAWRTRQKSFQIIPLYETGTVAINKDSRTITGSGTAFTSAMVGRYLRVDGDTSYYRIKAVSSGTSISLDIPYIDDSVSGKTYKIWKRFYNLVPDVDEILEINDEGAFNTKITSFDFHKPFTQGHPKYFKKAGYDFTETTYTTGDLSGTIDTQILTGNGTSWLDNVQEGDDIEIGTATYNVRSVDSDTQITLVQKQTATSAGGTSYTARRKRLVQIEFDYSPSETRNAFYTYAKRTFDMVNDDDEPEMPEKYVDVLVLGSLAFAGQYIGLEIVGETILNLSLKYEARIQQIKQTEFDNEDSGPDSFFF